MVAIAIAAIASVSSSVSSIPVPDNITVITFDLRQARTHSPVIAVARLGSHNSEEDDGESNLRKICLISIPRLELVEVDLTRSFMLSGVASVLD